LLERVKRVIVLNTLPALHRPSIEGNAVRAESNQQSLAKDTSMRYELTHPDPRGSEPLLSLVYRYFFFDWLFRDVTRGTLLERAAAWRFNCSSRHHLLVYLRRWLFVFATGYGLGVVFERAFQCVYAAACMYSSSCVSASVIFIILLSWFTLRPSRSGL
jgi:hypothetical protein